MIFKLVSGSLQYMYLYDWDQCETDHNELILLA